MPSGSIGQPSRSRGGIRKTQVTKLDQSSAQERFLDYYAAGLVINAALAKVGRARKTYEKWRRDDKEFAAKVDAIRSTKGTKSTTRDENRVAAMEMGFAAWRDKYLNVPTYRHQMQWIDILEGRDPRDLHPSDVYQPGSPGHILVNTPVFHAKSTTITVDYVTYRVCLDPNVRVAIISKRDQMASEFLGAVKDRLTQPRFVELIRDFAPEGGYKATAESWTSHRIYVGGDRDSADPNPTVQSLGLGSQIYGARLDLIILDDCITTENVNEWEKQLHWLNTQVLSRPGPDGIVLVVGTRLAPHDLYGQLRNPNNFGGDESPWTYMAQPAILEAASENSPAVTLWPYATEPWAKGDSRFSYCKTCRYYSRKSGEPKDCANESILIDGVVHWPRWDMFHLEWGPKRRMSPREWDLIYMQRATPEDAVFPEFAVKAAVNNRRRYGLEGGLESVPEHAYYIGSMDPATSGNAFALVLAVDRTTRKRYIVDAVNLKAPTPARLKSLIKEWSVLYPIKEWRVEKTGLLTMFTQDQELRSWLSGRGIVFKQHYTGSNKWDSSFGVASMASLFGAYDRTGDGIIKEIHPPLIDLPRMDTSGIKLLVEQLIQWSPELDPNRVPCDAVMALWFAEIAARNLIKAGDRGLGDYQKSKYISPRQKQKQRVFSFADRLMGIAK